MNNENGEDNDDGPVITMSSPEAANSRAGVNGDNGVEQSYIQSSMDNFEL